MVDPALISRRTLLAVAPSLIAWPALAAPPASGRLRFAVLRNGTRIGEHVMRFSGDGGARVITTEATMTVRLGPVPVFRYRHEATETWRDGRFEMLRTSTDSNGKAERVTARRTGDGVIIETAGGRRTAPAGAAPLTHWNAEVLDGPLFNPQTGKLVKVSATRLPAEAVATADGGEVRAVRWSLRGDAEIDNWYDAGGVWTALRGRLDDRSLLEYRRL